MKQKLIQAIEALNALIRESENPSKYQVLHTFLMNKFESEQSLPELTAKGGEVLTDDNIDEIMSMLPDDSGSGMYGYSEIESVLKSFKTNHSVSTESANQCEGADVPKITMIDLAPGYKTGFQLCPKCSGQGTVSRPPYISGDVTTFSDSNSLHECNVCNGSKIISIETGLPPTHPAPVNIDSLDDVDPRVKAILQNVNFATKTDLIHAVVRVTESLTAPVKVDLREYERIAYILMSELNEIKKLSSSNSDDMEPAYEYFLNMITPKSDLPNTKG